MRGEYISAIKAAKSDLSSLVQQLEEDAAKAAETFSMSPTPDNFGLLAQKRRELSLHLTSSTHLDMRSLASRVFESGDKNGKMLANLVTDLKTQTVISAINCADGTLTTEPSSILQEFTTHFGKLYEDT